MAFNFDRGRFDRFVAALELKHFTSGELLVGQYRKRNHPPPEELWCNMVPTIIVLDALREKHGGSVQLISGYRSEAYNDPEASNNPGRAKLSYHQAYSAFDFRMEGVKKDDLVKTLQSWNKSKWFTSPVGFARKNANLPSGAVIRIGVMPQVYSLGGFTAWGLLPACAFQFKGWWKSYAKSNFVHFDTRGEKLGSETDEDD
ncbi:D-Ala-D-Ala carboxypeptidase family metallohydrolase [Roseococcus sp. SYP-B2431]|uniref:D-Ala-D-Ala carboxypeptidase family metallohydrolase n=1 Tax=Roseococcus sp. SYP-B2431 TaxID=2496640 RepID=UPI0013F48DFA|nr:D-Ala-D-Ala carboxypeptidase family metallohydrolase [Roseococcus sp. SYP-B2431]